MTTRISDADAAMLANAAYRDPGVDPGSTYLGTRQEEGGEIRHVWRDVNGNTVVVDNDPHVPIGYTFLDRADPTGSGYYAYAWRSPDGVLVIAERGSVSWEDGGPDWAHNRAVAQGSAFPAMRPNSRHETRNTNPETNQIGASLRFTQSVIDRFGGPSSGTTGIVKVGHSKGGGTAVIGALLDWTSNDGIAGGRRVQVTAPISAIVFGTPDSTKIPWWQIEYLRDPEANKWMLD